jgi:peptidoglycan hydrolase-like protein with peptidoglycan-binding domain
MALLIRGSIGAGVTQLQADLDRCGYSSSDAPGVYSADTERVVRSFQDAYGLGVDGKAGDETLAKIAEVIASLTPPDAPE